MARLIKKTSKKPGLAPGTLVHVGEKKSDRVRIRAIDYDETSLQELELETIQECFPFKDTPTVTWINVDGLHRIEILEELGSHFSLHPLVLEDILNTDQRPKMEDFENHIFIVLKMLSYDDKNKRIESEQLSLILGPNFVLSFQKREGTVFNPVRERIRSGKGRIRKVGSDYLVYALVDAVVDNYYVILEKLGESIESLEERLISNPSSRILARIHELKREMIFVRKSVWPLRELISGLGRGESPLIADSTKIYLKDVYDHTIQIIDTVETYRDILSGFLDVYLSSISNRMNEVMKVLTLIATIFIPLTFIAGVYGMNFKYIPELEWHWAYFAVWIIMIVVAAFMFGFFKRKGWV